MRFLKPCQRSTNYIPKRLATWKKRFRAAATEFNNKDKCNMSKYARLSPEYTYLADDVYIRQPMRL